MGGATGALPEFDDAEPEFVASLDDGALDAHDVMTAAKAVCVVPIAGHACIFGS
jgi:hypothetical protein